MANELADRGFLWSIPCSGHQLPPASINTNLMPSNAPLVMTSEQIACARLRLKLIKNLVSRQQRPRSRSDFSRQSAMFLHLASKEITLWAARPCCWHSLAAWHDKSCNGNAWAARQLGFQHGTNGVQVLLMALFCLIYCAIHQMYSKEAACSWIIQCSCAYLTYSQEEKKKRVPKADKLRSTSKPFSKEFSLLLFIYFSFVLHICAVKVWIIFINSNVTQGDRHLATLNNISNASQWWQGFYFGFPRIVRYPQCTCSSVHPEQCIKTCT